MSRGPGFTKPGVWDGGHYELYAWWQGVDAARLERTHARRWARPGIDSYHTDRGREPCDQERTDPDALRLGLHNDHAGWSDFRLASVAGAGVPCWSGSMRFLGDSDERPVVEAVECALYLSLQLR